MKKLKELMAVILVTVLISGILLSCAGNTPSSSTNNNNNAVTADEDNTGENNEIIEDTTAEAKIEPDLPEENFGGYTFTFLTHLYSGGDWVNPTPLELVAEEENGEPINDAVYKRNMLIRDKYNIDIQMVANSDEKGTMSKAVKAGDSIYDAVIMFNNNVPGIITGDLLLDTSYLPYIDLDKPWWDPAVKSMSIVNKSFLLAGDLLILDNEATNALMFSKDLTADLGLELPYSLVKEGKWTMDAMNVMCKAAGADLNGDGAMTAFEDRWGFTVFNDTLQALLVSGGGAFAVKNEEDIPYMDFASERNLNVLGKAMDLMYNPEYVVNVQAPPKGGRSFTDGYEVYQAGFEGNQMLFLWVRMRVVEYFRGMEGNFGIIPMPKYDESQDSYYSLVNPYTGALLGVPKSAEDLDRVSIILEALAAESRYTLQPAYYDIVLTRKYTRDEESEEMLDIIFNSRIYDIGGVYSFGNVFGEFTTMAGKQDRNVISLYEKKIGAMEKAIDKVVETFQSMS